MSIKINNAFCYKLKEVSDVAKLHKSIMEGCQYSYYCEFVEFIAENVIKFVANTIINKSDHGVFYKLIDDYVLLNRIDIDMSEHMRADDSILGLCSEDYDERTCMMRVIQSLVGEVYMLFSRLNRMYDGQLLSTEVHLYYVDDLVLIVPNSSSEHLTNNLLSIDGVEDYHYQNSCDKPDYIPTPAWEKRRDEWEEATTTYFTTFHFGNRATIRTCSPNSVDTLMPYTKNFTDFDKELCDMAQDVITVISRTYTGCKRGLLREHVERCIMRDIPMANSRHGISWYLNRINRLYKQYASHYESVISEVEKHMDSIFSTIIDVE